MEDTTPFVPSPPTLRQAVVAAVAGALGNVVEWFDFLSYGYLAERIGEAFFPSSSSSLQLLQSFAVFAVGYFARPFGAVILGHVGDKYGRRVMLLCSLSVMCVSSIALGAVPPYKVIGAAAPILLVFLRLLQGLSVGGEYTGAITFCAESAPPSLRAVLASAPSLGSTIGSGLAAGVAAAVTEACSEENTYCWRTPFFIGGFAAAVGVVVRWAMHETHRPDDMTLDAPLGRGGCAEWCGVLVVVSRLFRRWWREMGKIGCIVAFANVTYYVVYVAIADSVDSVAAQAAAAYSQVIGSVALLAAAYFADRYGAIPVCAAAQGALAVLSPPLVIVVLSGHSSFLPWALCILAIPAFAIFGVHGVIITSLIPRHSRCLAVSLSYSITLAAFGGTAPMIATALLDWPWLVAAYPLLFFPFSMLALWSVRNQVAEKEQGAAF